MNSLDRHQPTNLEDDWHYSEANDGEAERDKADNDLDILKNDL